MQSRELRTISYVLASILEFILVCDRLNVCGLMISESQLGGCPANSASGKFYKGECQEKTPPRGRMFSYFPARVIEQDLF